MLGRDAIRAEAIDDIVQDVFVEALEQAEIEPYGRPTLEDMKPEPLVLEFLVPLQPVVTLGEDYREMRREIEPVNVTDEAVEEALEQIQIQHQTTEPVDRAAEAGDLVTVGGRGELTPLEAAESAEADEEIAETDEPDQEAVETDDQEETLEPESELLFDQEQLELLMDGEKLFPGTPFVDNIVGHRGRRRYFV